MPVGLPSVVRRLSMVPLTMTTMLILTISTVFVTSAANGDEAKAPFTVFGYLPEYRLSNFDYDAAFNTGLTHLIYFSLEIDPKGLPTALDRLPSKEDAARARKAADRVGGKVIISFGGNSRSQNFGTMATNSKKRRLFLEALDMLLINYDFDGVDYNWEYPHNDQEWHAWGTLMAESKEYLRSDRRTPSNADDGSGAVVAAAAAQQRNVVTFTMYLDPHHYQIITRYNLLAHADFVHCMAYDQHHHHSTMAFFASGIHLAQVNHFNLKKFTMGLPFYARHVMNGEPKTYAELLPEISNDHEDQVGPYYFNSKALIEAKTRKAIEEGLGGVMIWELGQDVQPLDLASSLMSSIAHAVHREPTRRHARKNDGGPRGGRGDEGGAERGGEEL